MSNYVDPSNCEHDWRMIVAVVQHAIYTRWYCTKCRKVEKTNVDFKT